MDILCDTHILIWYLTGDNQLSKKARELLDSDRLLLSQAKSDGLILLTHDTLIPYYNEHCVMSV